MSDSATMPPFTQSVYENGATYFSVSGAIREKTAPFEGGVWFTRLRGKLAGILSGLTVDDAKETYAAIRYARPGGLGLRAGMMLGRVI